MKLAVCLFVVAAGAAQAQMLLKIPDSFSKLADKAEEVVDVTLDPATLGLASKFLSDKDSDEKAAKKVVSGLKGIYVRSYTFAKEGEYSDADVELLRAQLRGPGWSCIVNVRSKKDRENAQVCFFSQNGTVAGLAIVATEPKELTIVNIAGFIDKEHLGLLEGQFGIPKTHTEEKQKKQDKDDD
jgi:hypothetical protein